MQVAARGDDVLVFSGTAPNRIRRLAESASVHHSQPIIDREHSVSAAGQVLIHRVSVVVVVHVMEAEHHLADGASMHEDQAGNFTAGIPWKEELAVHSQSIFTFEDHLFRGDE